MALTKNQQGQISIFFSASLVVVISIIAFVINIGLFVKAKINLQNATDSAAFAGAAVQARQLTKIGYLNWEMRNIYKEWMYKYYVIGNLNIQDVETPNVGSGPMQFNLQKDVNVLEDDPVKKETTDKFNIPAVCIHIAGSRTNICKRYSIPGLPEFGSSNLTGAEEASRAFMDALISTKVNDCVDRTQLNMTVANTWTYNVLANTMDESLTGNGPAILSDRQGAWPRAVELAMRIRNLEFAMNRPAETSKVCIEGSNSVTNCQKNIADIEAEKKLGNERLVKAFYSAYRNLGNDVDQEMKNSFTLTEIAPKSVDNPSETNASNFLIPTDKIYPKQWVDLKLMMVNYAIFYAAMIPRADSKTSGACDVSKVAIPVPGYPLGFYKNPDILTYYAVKGEAEFVGMFNPFAEGSVKLQAYSAAKPFGGRIGPVLFHQKVGQDFLTSRADPLKFRSVPYITSYDFSGITIRGKSSDNGNYVPGIPLPTNPPGQPFWVQNPDSPIGGKLADADGIQFGVPNLVYDYQEPFKVKGYTNETKSIYKILATGGPQGTADEIGLYSRFQFNNFKGTGLSATISPEALDAEIGRVRAPTLYEAANYLIPTPAEFNKSADIDSFGFIGGGKISLNNGYERYRGNVYAPLYDPDQVDVLFTNSSDVVSAIKVFMKAQETGIKKYKMALNSAARSIFGQQNEVSQGALNSKEGYIKAANGVSDIDFGNPSNDQMPATCKSIAGQFLYFYYGGGTGVEVPDSPAGCPKPLGDLILEYFNKSTISQTSFSPEFYPFELNWKSGTSAQEGKKFLTAYRPGPFTGINEDGSYTSPLASDITDNMQRNSYSTKFITLDSLQTGGGPRWDNDTFAIYSENGVDPAGSETRQKTFANPIQTSDDISSIKY